MARNLIDLVNDYEDEDIEVFEKRVKPKKHGNKNIDYFEKTTTQERIKRQRREKQKMRKEAEKETNNEYV